LVHRAARWIVLVSLLALLASPVAARVRHNDAWARQQFSKAERMREALNGRPAGERTRHEYQRVIDAFRRVYFGSPASSKADPSVVATAELMVEMGQRFDDNKVLRGAVEQYRFLRKEYPGSKYRFDALFTIGEIYKDDLDDPEEARSTFEDFVHRYPRNRLADDARAAVKEIDQAADEMERAERKGRPDEPKEVAHTLGRSTLPRVTGVRHWSTPDYTRVAIDIERDVKFNSSRISNPDRIFFDLRDTKLASTLVGKTFDVDDGFLKKIRVAEFQPGRTRVVLEVDDLSTYDAFLLPDPYRLIIDIHGKKSRGTMLAKTQGERGAELLPDTTSGGSASSGMSSSGTASADADDEAADAALDEKGGQRKSEKEHAIVAKADKGSAESDEDDASTTPTGKAAKAEIAKSTDTGAKSGHGSKSAGQQSGSNSGVVRTTVAVKGSNVRIPKTIVPADDSPRTSRSARAKNHTSGASVSSAATNDDASASPAPSSADAEEAMAVSPDKALSSATPSEPATKTSTMSKSSLSARRKKGHASPNADSAADLEVREAQPMAAGDRSLTRALGLKIGKIVIDAGHGGHDTGTIGPHGLLEKDLVLDVARRLGRLLQTRMGAEVVYTRRDDTFVPLETRTAIANREQADLFISIHANSSHDEDARGVETYYLNFTSSPEALEVAARENAVSEKSVHELQDLVKKIALKEKIDESREFAGDVQDSLYGGLSLRNSGIRNRGVKKAPFIVLIGANMPSILAEISFVSNPTDERKLETSEQRQKIAESLYRGVARYAGGLSGVKVASRGLKNEGQ
jgi:N-acetylmuramoyl-L-alanine amidase